MTFFFNKQTGEVLGRSGLSWLKIAIFYIVFYIMLFGFFILMLSIALLIMPFDKPNYTGDAAFSGNEPGLSYVPVFRNGKGDDAENSFIFDLRTTNVEDRKNPKGKDDPAKVENMADQLEKYFAAIAKANDGNMDCSNTVKANKTHACKVPTPKNNAEKFKDCATNPYGWQKPNATDPFEPCILIKMNRAYDWKPSNKDLIKSTTDDQAQKSRSEAAANGTNETTTNAPTNAQKGDAATSTTIKCKATGKKGSFVVEYKPSDGIPTFNFPFLKQPGYVNPFIMIKLKNMTTNNEKVVEAQCFTGGDYDKDGERKDGTKAKIIKFQFVFDKKLKDGKLV